MSDHKVLTQLFAAHAKQVKRFFRQRVGRAGDVQDLNQEVFLRLLRVRDLESISDPQGYLFTVAANLLRERAHSAKERRREVRLPVEEVLDAPELTFDSPAEGEMDKTFLLRRLRTALNQLSAHDREVLTMVYEEKLSYREIARHHGTSKSAVERTVARATAQCRKLMDLAEDI